MRDTNNTGLRGVQDPPPESRVFSANVEATRKAMGKTKQWLADQCGTHRANISNILRGKQTNISLDTMSAIAEAIGQPLHELLNPDFSPPKPKESGTAREQFIAKLKEHMELHGITQAALAQAAGIHQPNISRILNCKEGITISRAIHLAESIGLTLTFDLVEIEK